MLGKGGREEQSRQGSRRRGQVRGCSHTVLIRYISMAVHSSYSHADTWQCTAATAMLTTIARLLLLLLQHLCWVLGVCGIDRGMGVCGIDRGSA